MSNPSRIDIESPGINVAIIKKDPDGWKFLMLRRADKEIYPGLWGFLTGGREGGETVPQLAVREMAEETGLTPEKLWATEYVFQFYEPTVDKIWLLPVVVAVVAPGSRVKLSPENSDFRWLDGSAAIDLVIWQNLKEVLRNINRELAGYPAGNWIEITP